MKCYNCDTLLEENWNYCPNCKRKLRKNKIIEEEFVSCNEVNKCHTCSCDLNGNWNFCPVCGTSVEFYSDKAFVSVPTIATNDQVTTAPLDNNVEINEKAEAGKYCEECGTKALEKHAFCATCGHALKENNVVLQEKPIDDKHDNGYILWIVVAYLSPIVGVYLSDVHDLFSLIGSVVGFFSIVYAKATYKNNKIVSIFFWLYIALAIISIAAFLLLVFFFVAACEYCLGDLSV